MTSTERGMFCSNCRKEVINYQYYSNNQLLKSLNESKKICGRFSPNQIDKELNSIETNLFHRIGLLFGFSSLFLTTPAFSQSEKSKTEIIENKSDDELKQKSSNEFIEFYGKILEKPRNNNDKSYPIPGVNIIQKDTKNVVQSNIDGNFIIKIPIEDFKDKVVLIFNFIGMETKEVEVFKTNSNLKIEMILSDALMGEVIIVKTKKRNIFKRIGNLFK
ncbi:carboxypeptidase-like regulatory domain-containing protein [Flavobacterium sp. WC2509]|uniref:carboxypeptidase-like regulatory domain-containing protein n=1 Tax=Flavobacterium sp. WC2509 TaxID=3461406 RepID=UPI004044FB88